MAATRLTKSLRQEMYRFVSRQIDPQEERKALEAARKKAAPLVRSVVEKKYPPVDMEVLKKYHKANIDDCIKVVCTREDKNTPLMFRFEDDAGPLVADMTYSRPPYDTPLKTYEAVVAFSKAEDAYEEAKKAIQNDYYALIFGSRTLEAVAKVWPDAEKFRPVKANLPAIGEDAIKRIEADIASRKK